MFVCADCYTECEGHEKHPQAAACDEFDGQEEENVQQDVYGDDVYTLKDAQDEIESLTSYCIGQHDRIMELERKFDTIISAVIKASSPEEER